MTIPALLDASARPIPSTEIERIRTSASLGLAGDYEAPFAAASYLRQDVAAWRPANVSGDYASLQRRDITIARVQDLLRNDRHARAAENRLIDMLVGKGLLYCPKPDYVALGISHEASRDLARQMKAEWRHFAEDPRRYCDRTRKLTMNGLWRQFARTMSRLGECTAVMTLNDFPGRYRTSVLAVDPFRLSNPSDRSDTPTLRGGVEMDEAGVPVAYHVRNAHQGDYWAGADTATWTRVPRETDWGRPVFVHGFEPDREGDTRGVSPFVTLVNSFRMLGKIADHEAAAKALNALFGAFVTSSLPAEEVARKLTTGGNTLSGSDTRLLELLTHFQKYPVTLGGVRIPVLPPGTQVSMNTAERQTAGLQMFQTAFLQSAASVLGLSYEQVSMDWSRTNYSSARAALNEVWRSLSTLFARLVDQVATPILFAVMDEAFDRGFLRVPKGCPDFMEMPGAYLRARWIGPGRGYIDPVKEAEGSALRQEGLVSTLEDELAELGRDLEETLDQIEFENAELKRRGLSRQSLVAAIQQANKLKPDSQEAEEPVPAREDP